MTQRQIWDLILRKHAVMGRYANAGEHGIERTPKGTLTAYVNVCPQGCIGEYVAEHTDYVCTVVEKCPHGYFWYYD